MPDKSFEVQKGEKVLIAQPKVVPEKLLENLSAVFRSVDEIEEAFFAQVWFASRSEKPHIIIQVKFRNGSKGDLKPLDSSIREAIRGTVSPDIPVDFMVTDEPNAASRRFYTRA